MTLGNMKERKTRNVVLMTGFVMWDRILTDEEILESSQTCQETKGNPTMTWSDFYEPAESNAAAFVIKPSKCKA